jgi:RsiW-degrading membrane proteinase PrsW (M82 family)
MKDEVVSMKEHVIPDGWKQAAMVTGAILMFLGLPLCINLICAVSSYDSSYENILYSVFSFLAVVLTLGVGLAMFVHGNSSFQKKPSKPLRLPPIPLLVGAFGLLLMFGFTFFSVDFMTGLFFPPTLVALAILPPLWSVAWFAGTDLWRGMDATSTGGANGTQITWRRGMMAFIGGGTIGVFVALILEIILPVLVLVLVFNLGDMVTNSVSALFDALAGSDIAQALTNPGFIYIFIHIAIIAPLAEELAKPLVLLPILRQVNREEAFLLGAFAGAGFAALENVIYAASGYEIWSGILLVRSLGGALHPLGAGLMALAWHDVLCGEQGAWSKWVTRFAIAAGVHAAWNGGSLLVITLGGAGFFGALPKEIGIPGYPAAGATLAFLILLGISALWIGRVFGLGKSPKVSLEGGKTDASPAPSERTLAIWALACLTAIVPIGIAGLSLWLR